MNIQITKSLQGVCANYYTLTTDSVEAFVGLYHDGRVNVLCKNSSHRAYRGSGNYFRDLSHALEHYKSDAMKKIIMIAAGANSPA
jgi:hypothetical protein